MSKILCYAYVMITYEPYDLTLPDFYYPGSKLVTLNSVKLSKTEATKSAEQKPHFQTSNSIFDSKFYLSLEYNCPSFGVDIKI